MASKSHPVLAIGSSEGGSSTGVGDLRPKGEDGRLKEGIFGGLIDPPRFRMEEPMLPKPFFRPPCMLFMPPCIDLAADTVADAAATIITLVSVAAVAVVSRRGCRPYPRNRRSR